MKKFSIGLSDTLTIEEQSDIFSTYGKNIDYLYYSVPLGIAFQTRTTIYKRKTVDEAKRYLKNVLLTALGYGIKTELCLNAYNLSTKDLSRMYRYIKTELNISPDAVVLLDEYYDAVKSMFPDAYLIYSFNNGARKASQFEKIMNKYNEVVVIPMPNQNNEEIWETAKSKGFNVRMMLNNGCSPNCFTCRNSKLCKEVFNNNLQKYGIDYCIATQTVFPEEVHSVFEASDKIDSYKISSRPCSYKYLCSCLNDYINKKNADLNKLGHYGRMTSLSNHYKDDINFEKVYEIKSQMWGKPIIDFQKTEQTTTKM